MVAHRPRAIHAPRPHSPSRRPRPLGAVREMCSSGDGRGAARGLVNLVEVPVRRSLLPEIARDAHGPRLTGWAMRLDLVEQLQCVTSGGPTC